MAATSDEEWHLLTGTGYCSEENKNLFRIVGKTPAGNPKVRVKFMEKHDFFEKGYEEVEAREHVAKKHKDGLYHLKLYVAWEPDTYCFALPDEA